MIVLDAALAKAGAAYSRQGRQMVVMFYFICKWERIAYHWICEVKFMSHDSINLVMEGLSVY